MRLLFISDIHGRMINLNYIEKLIEKNQFDKVIVLGDLYSYYDNDLNYQINNFITKYVDICVKGNCDNEDDLKDFDIPIIYDIDCLHVDGINLYITHGDQYNNERNNKSDFKGVLVFGHKHYPFITKKNDMTYICVGSISLPRENSNPCYMIYENRRFIIYNIYGDIVDGIEV